ncbi:unnamed protein product [Urochloa humidicola]
MRFLYLFRISSCKVGILLAGVATPSTAKFEDEIKSELKHTEAGILSMENAGPNTYGSQFFITFAPCQSIDGNNTIFGRVYRGTEIVKCLGSVQTDKK